MNCEKFEEFVHELDRPGSGAPGKEPNSESEAALAHAESCSRCAKLLTEVEGLNFALRAIASQDAREMAPARVEAALLGEFRRQGTKSRREQARNDGKTLARFKAYLWYGTAGSAAVAALFALGLIRGWMSMPRRQPARTPTSTTATAENAGSTKRPLHLGHSVVTPKVAQGNGSAGDAAESEQANDFYALPYADDLASLDGGAVIRVSVPRSELVAWGLPLSGIGGAEPVPADLVVSADGTPQAIRLVAQSNE